RGHVVCGGPAGRVRGLCGRRDSPCAVRDRRRPAVGRDGRGLERARVGLPVLRSQARIAAALRGGREVGTEADQREHVEDDRNHEGEVRDLSQLLIDHCALPSEKCSPARAGRSWWGPCGPSRVPSCACASEEARAWTSPSSDGSSLRASPATSSTAPSAVSRTRTQTRLRGTKRERISPPTATRALNRIQRSKGLWAMSKAAKRRRPSKLTVVPSGSSNSWPG